MFLPLLILSLFYPTISYVLNQYPVSILSPTAYVGTNAPYLSGTNMIHCFQGMTENVNCPSCTQQLWTPSNKVRNGVEITGLFAHNKIAISNNWAFGFLSADIIVYRRFDNGHWGHHQLIKNAVDDVGHWVSMKTNNNVLIATWFNENYTPSYRVYVFKNINDEWSKNEAFLNSDRDYIFTVDSMVSPFYRGFGYYPNSIDINNRNDIIVGAPDLGNSGYVYIYKYQSGTWSNNPTLRYENGMVENKLVNYGYVAMDNCGRSVTLSDSFAVYTCTHGIMIHKYDVANNQWPTTTKSFSIGAPSPGNSVYTYIEPFQIFYYCNIPVHANAEGFCNKINAEHFAIAKFNDAVVSIHKKWIALAYSSPDDILVRGVTIYRFTKDEDADTTNDAWVFDDQIRADRDVGNWNLDGFGMDVAMNDNVLVVGSRRAGAYVFTRIEGKDVTLNSNWNRDWVNMLSKIDTDGGSPQRPSQGSVSAWGAGE